MILAAALLVLLGLALFVGGVLTDITLLYWACVAACVVAGVFLVLARMRMGGAPAARASRASTSAGGPGPRAPATAQLPAVGGAAAAGTATSERSAPAGTAPASRPITGAEPGDGSPGPAEPAAATPEPQAAVAADGPEPAGAHAPRGVPGPEDRAGDPPVEEVEVTDLLLVLDLRDEVLVVDEHPRYHLAGCRWLGGRETIPLPVDEARTDGFTPCRWCAPDRTLADRERARRARRKG